MSRQEKRVPLELRGLGGEVQIFRLSGAVQTDPAVEAWLMGHPSELRPLALDWFRRIRRCGSDVLDLLHDGCPVACVRDAPFAYVNIFKKHVNVGFFYGAFLRDPARLLEGAGKRMRHVKLAAGIELNASALAALIDAAYEDIKLRLDVDQTA